MKRNEIINCMVNNIPVNFRGIKCYISSLIIKTINGKVTLSVELIEKDVRTDVTGSMTVSWRQLERPVTKTCDVIHTATEDEIDSIIQEVATVHKRF